MIFRPSARGRHREHPRLADASTTVSDRLVGRTQSLLADIRARGARTSRNPNADVGRRSRTCCDLSAATERRIMTFVLHLGGHLRTRVSPHYLRWLSEGAQEGVTHT